MAHQTQRFVSFDEPDSPLGRIKLCVLSNNGWGIPPNAMRELDHYRISYVLEGTGQFGDEYGFEQSIRPGDLVCQFPGVKHYYMSDNGQPWTRFYIAFEGPVFDLWCKEGLLDVRRPVTHIEPINYWLSRLRNIVESHQPAWRGRSLIEVSRLQELFAEVYCQREDLRQPASEVQWLEQVCRAIEAAPSPVLDLQDIARKHGMSYAAFRSRFTKLAGTSPGKYRTLRLIAKAGHMVVQSSKPLKEIAAELHFADEFHFSRRFKKITGHSPREFRRLYRNADPKDLAMNLETVTLGKKSTAKSRSTR